MTQPHFVAEPGTGVHRALAGSTARGARAPRSRSEHRALRVYGRRLPNARRRSLPPEPQREPETQPWLDRRAKLVVQEAPHRPLLRAEAPAPARVRAGRATGGRARAVHRPVPARDGQGAPAPRSRPHSRPRIPLGHKKRERRHRQTVRISAISGLLFFSFRVKRVSSRARRPPRAFFRFLTRSRLFPRNPAGRLEHPGKMRGHRRRRPPAHDAASERRGGGPRRRRRRRRETLRLGSARRRRRIRGPDGERGRNCGCFNRGRFKGCGCFDRGCFNR